MIKYAIIIFIFSTVVFGAYYCGLEVGRSNAISEYVTMQAENMKYVEMQKSAIYRTPNADRNSLLNKMRTGEL